MAAATERVVVWHVHHHFVYYFKSEHELAAPDDDVDVEDECASPNWRQQSIDLTHNDEPPFLGVEGQLKTKGQKHVFCRLAVTADDGPVLQMFAQQGDALPRRQLALTGALVTRSDANAGLSLTLYAASGGGATVLCFASDDAMSTWERALVAASSSATPPLRAGEEGAEEEHRHKHLFHRQHNDLSELPGERSESEAIRQSERSVRCDEDGVRQRYVHHVYRLYQNVDALQRADGAAGDVAELRQHLRWALRIELSAIPPYLFAMYSMVDRECDGYKLLKSIAAEEMLHVSLAANLLTSIGGVPVFYNPAAMVTYPVRVPHHCDLQLELAPLSVDVLERQFLKLEQPCGADVRDMRASQIFPQQSGEYATIGELYRAIEGAFERLARQQHSTLFANPRVHLQMKPHNYKNVKHTVEDSGGLLPVTDIQSARAAIATIMHQGEGVEDRMYADAGGKQLTHYYKLQLLRDEFDRRVGAVYPCVANPKTSQFSPPLQVVSRLFNAAYAALMLTIQELYQEEDVRGQLHVRSYALMEACLRPAGQILCQSPIQPGAAEHAGPTFEPFLFDDGQEPLAVVKSLAAQVIELFPADTEKMKKGVQKL